jgi:hypothetical protein
MDDAEKDRDDEALAILTENFVNMLSPRGLQTAAIMLLCRIAHVAEASGNPGVRAGMGASLIRTIADGACEIYPKAEWPEKDADPDDE